METKEIRENVDKTTRKKKKYRRNFVDVLIVFLIAASIISFFYRGWLENSVNRFLADNSITVRFVIEGLDADLAENFGLERGFTYEGGEFGTLQDFEVNSATTRVVRARSLDGVLFYGVERITDPRHRSVEGTFLIRGSRKDSGFYLGGTARIAAGMTFEIFAKEQKYTILVTKIG